MKTYNYLELRNFQFMELPDGFTRALSGEITSRILGQLGVEHVPDQIYTCLTYIDLLDPKQTDPVESVTAVIEEIYEDDNVGPIVMERYVCECYRFIKGQTEQIPEFVADATKAQFAPFVMPALDLYAKALADTF